MTVAKGELLVCAFSRMKAYGAGLAGKWMNK